MDKKVSGRLFKNNTPCLLHQAKYSGVAGGEEYQYPGAQINKNHTAKVLNNF
jgi:hypothetical protein